MGIPWTLEVPAQHSDDDDNDACQWCESMTDERLMRVPCVATGCAKQALVTFLVCPEPNASLDISFNEYNVFGDRDRFDSPFACPTFPYIDGENREFRQPVLSRKSCRHERNIQRLCSSVCFSWFSGFFFLKGFVFVAVVVSIVSSSQLACRLVVHARCGASSNPWASRLP